VALRGYADTAWSVQCIFRFLVLARFVLVEIKLEYFLFIFHFRTFPANRFLLDVADDDDGVRR